MEFVGRVRIPGAMEIGRQTRRRLHVVRHAAALGNPTNHAQEGPNIMPAISL